MTQEDKFLQLILELKIDYELTYFFNNTLEYPCEHHYILRTSSLEATTNIGGFRDHYMAYAFHKGTILGTWINHGIPGERQHPKKVDTL